MVVLRGRSATRVHSLRLASAGQEDLVASSRQLAADAAAQQRQGHGRTGKHTINPCCLPVCGAMETIGSPGATAEPNGRGSRREDLSLSTAARSLSPGLS